MHWEAYVSDGTDPVPMTVLQDIYHKLTFQGQMKCQKLVGWNDSQWGGPTQWARFYSYRFVISTLKETLREMMLPQVGNSPKVREFWFENVSWVKEMFTYILIMKPFVFWAITKILYLLWIVIILLTKTDQRWSLYTNLSIFWS